MRRRLTPRASCAVGLLLGAGTLMALEIPGESIVDPRADRAIELYEAGSYRESRLLLEQLEAAGLVSGPLLYRLYYCQQATGAIPQARNTLEQARELLEAELESAADLEVPFYLVNAYQNLNRSADVRGVAERTTKRVEEGTIPDPVTGLDQFRLGKLYADLGRTEPATRWYTAAIESFRKAGDTTHGAYVRWASRYLAAPAYARGEFETAARYYRTALEDGGGTVEDFDRLAVTMVRLERYPEAADAWRRAEKLDRAGGDRARYCTQLAQMAGSLDGLPAGAPIGKAWADLTQVELETLMSETAASVREKVAAARTGPEIDEPRRKQINADLRLDKGVFVAAALEYAARGHGIREAAFFGGYAPLVFQKSAWKVGKRRTIDPADQAPPIADPTVGPPDPPAPGS